ncbi:MAG: GYDIA family GHMP kinase [Saprospiraceae bacterium]|nr:GYDIA family GHMP kinase [Saprospiraceae bacterium]
MNKKSFYTHGKLLLSAEYFVLDGALALALPVKYGQFLDIDEGTAEYLEWQSFDADRQKWFEAKFRLADFSFFDENDAAVAQQLQKILLGVRVQNPSFLSENLSLSVKTRLTFPRKWGFGSSSTLIAAVATWGGVDPFQLLRDSFGGSGYDIACAIANGPLLYQLSPRSNFVEIPFHPSFKGHVFFVYLGKKQSSREGIARYRKQAASRNIPIEEITNITYQILQSDQLQQFEDLIAQHEALVAQVIGLDKVKDKLFADYWGQVKSLGAWGGDFVLATSNRSKVETKQYFFEKGYKTVFSYSELIRCNLS